MIGSIIGGAVGVGSSIFGGISASKAMKEAKKSIENQRKANQNWYDRRYNEDATQRADAQRILSTTYENARRQNRQAAGVSAVMGGTPESAAATKAANAQAMAEAASRIAVAGEARKDNIESQYRATDQALDAQLANMEMQKANAISQAMSGVAQAGATLGAQSYSDLLKGNSETSAKTDSQQS